MKADDFALDFSSPQSGAHADVPSKRLMMARCVKAWQADFPSPLLRTMAMFRSSIAPVI